MYNYLIINTYDQCYNYSITFIHNREVQEIYADGYLNDDHSDINVDMVKSDFRQYDNMVILEYVDGSLVNTEYLN